MFVLWRGDCYNEERERERESVSSTCTARRNSLRNIKEQVWKTSRRDDEMLNEAQQEMACGQLEAESFPSVRASAHEEDSLLVVHVMSHPAGQQKSSNNGAPPLSHGRKETQNISNSISISYLCNWWRSLYCLGFICMHRHACVSYFLF